MSARTRNEKVTMRRLRPMALLACLALSACSSGADEQVGAADEAMNCLDCMNHDPGGGGGTVVKPHRVPDDACDVDTGSDDHPSVGVVALGDSIVWGQGLVHDDKFSTRTQRWIEDRLGRSASVLTCAHAGAEIAAMPDENAEDDFREPLRKNGEIPDSFPTILHQVDLAVAQTAAAHLPETRVVLLDGGINDGRIMDILFGDSEARALEKARDLCGGRMRTLLGAAVQSFPHATIVVTPYDPVFSPIAPIGVIDSFAQLLDRKALDYDAARRMSETYATACNAAIAGAVDDVRREKGTEAIVLSPLEWQASAHSLGAGPGSIRLFSVGVDDARWTDRAASCPVTDFRCKLASFGHPNRAGAAAYFDGIRAALEPRFDDVAARRDFGHSAAFVSASVSPIEVVAGQPFTVRITMRNTHATASWLPGDVELRPYGSTQLGPAIPLDHEVAPGGEATFSATITAPAVASTRTLAPAWRLFDGPSDAWVGAATSGTAVRVDALGPSAPPGGGGGGGDDDSRLCRRFPTKCGAARGRDPR